MSELAVLKERWATHRASVDAQLECYLQQLGPDCPDRLREAMAYSLLGGGKRLRPLLVLAACEACGGEVEAALPAACALEMVHTYSLIHDDLPAMDDDTLRRGRPTNHVQFDEATAILAGDGLLTLAFEILARDVSPPEVAAACCAELASAAGVAGMVGGQVADLEAEQRVQGSKSEVEQSEIEQSAPVATDGAPGPPPVGFDSAQDSSPAPFEAPVAELESIHRRKTGRLFGAALVLGGRIAGAEAQIRQSLQTYGKNVGLAFQITDDLLDANGEETTMGKGVRKDAENGKLTYPGLLGEARSRHKAEELIEEACRALASLGERARPLDTLARFVTTRNH